MTQEREVGVRSAIEAAFRDEHGKILSVLARDLGDIDLAEEALQDALAEALRIWPSQGSPDRVGAWILTIARSRAVDRLRRRARGHDKERAAGATSLPEDPVWTALLEDDDVPDERLRLMFTCCHPAIARRDAVALTLRVVAGLRTPEIAAAFLVKNATMQARITRAKARIREAGIRYRVPEHHELPDRLPPVIDVVTLIYNQGYTPVGDAAARASVRAEALRLADVLASHLPDEPEALATRALLLLHEARSTTRVDADGMLLTLPEMDRTKWRKDLADEGEQLLEEALRRGQPGPVQLQAAISALHTHAPSYETTDWQQIVVLYDELLSLAPSPTTAVARALAVGCAEGPEAGLAAMPDAAPPMDSFHRWHAVRADLLRRRGDAAGAAASFDRAAHLATNSAERRWLERQSTQLRASLQ